MSVENFLRELSDYVAANSTFTQGTTLFTGIQPDSPDRCITLVDIPIDWFWGGLYFWQIQFLARAFDYWDARSDSYAIFNLLSQKGHALSSYIICYTEDAMPPTFVGRDDLGRVLISARYNMRYKEV